MDLFADFFFKDTLELYDWLNGLIPDAPSVKTELGGSDENSSSQKFFYFLPRFESRGLDNELELLGMDQIMQYFIGCDKPLIDQTDLKRLIGRVLDNHNVKASSRFRLFSGTSLVRNDEIIDRDT